MADQQTNVSVELDDVAKVASNLASLSESISSVLENIYSTVSEIADGAISGTAPNTLIETYEEIHSKLATYPTTLTTLSENLSTSGNLFDSIDSAASKAANKTQG